MSINTAWDDMLWPVTSLWPALFAICAATPQAGTDPLADAVAVWHMADGSDSAGRDSALASHGNARLGVELTGADREASLKRGGDGRVVHLDGGWLSADQGAGGELALTGKAMTLLVRLRDPSGKWDAPLLSKHGGHARLTYNLYSSKTELGFELGTDFSPQPLRLSVPLAKIGPVGWHDVAVRYAGPNLEMFVDGILVDEEWPIGSLRTGNTEPCLIGGESTDARVKAGFSGMIDHAALWSRALSDAEILRLSGGTAPAPGPSAPSLQYWKPPGHNTSAGDCMPFYHDGTFHLFYLFDRRHHRSKFGKGAHQWAHASTRDLVRWTHHPMAIPITDEREGSICTGSVFFNEGTFHAFYATRMADGSGEKLSLAVSPDAIRFTKTEPNPFAVPEPGYGPKDFRDPNVFRDDRTGLFHMLISSKRTETGKGCLARLVSKNLRDWKPAEPFLEGQSGVPECPDHFSWNGWNYLLTNRYWMSRDVLGPWEKPKSDVLDLLPVPKTAAFTNNRRLYASWLPEGGFGGCIVFREVIQHPDGTLGMKFVPEMIPATGEPIALPREVRVSTPEGEALALPRNARFTARLQPSAGASAFGLRLRGREIRFRPASGRIEIAKGASLSGVEGLDRPFTLDLILKDDILDLCVDNRRTLIMRVPDKEGGGVSLFCDSGEVRFDSLEVRPLR